MRLVPREKKRKSRKRSKSIHDRFCKKKEFWAGSSWVFDGTLPGGMEDRRFVKNFWMWADRRNETDERTYRESKELSKNAE